MLLQRLQGKQVTLITGTDEHGEKIALAAAAKGLDPQQHCNEIAELYKSLWKLVSHLRLACSHPCSCVASSSLRLTYDAMPCTLVAKSTLFSYHRSEALLMTLLQLDIQYDSFVRTTSKQHEVCCCTLTLTLTT